MKKTLLSIIGILVITTVNAQMPNYEWTKTMGGTSLDWGAAICVDDSGYIYTTGRFEGSGPVDFDPGPGTHFFTPNGLSDIYIQKLDASGNLVWAKSMGNIGWDVGLSIAVDNSGNVYTTGNFEKYVDFDPGPGVHTLGYGGSYVQKLDSEGNFLWAISFEQVSSDDLIIDSLGNVYVTGRYWGTVDFDPGLGTHIYSSKPGSGGQDTEGDIFILKLDNGGNFLWAKSIGSHAWDRGIAMCLDELGNLYTVGTFGMAESGTSTADFDPGLDSTKLTTFGNGDIFIQKLNASGDFIWAKSLGGTGDDSGEDIYYTNGNIYLTGSFEDTVDFDPGASSFNLISMGGDDIFVSKMDSAGNFIWAKSMGNIGKDWGESINVDAIGNVYTTGRFGSTTLGSGTVDFDPGAGVFNLNSGGASDIFIQKLDSMGDFVWAVRMGGFTYDSGVSTMDDFGNIYTTGAFQVTVDFDPGTAATDTAYFYSNGDRDIFIHKLSQCMVDVSTTLSGATITANTAGATYQWIDCADNSAITGATAQSYTATANGNYAVVIDNGTCSDTSACVAITTLSIDGFNELNNSITIYPNPTTGLLYIDYEDKINNIEIIDVMGKTVLQESAKNKQVQTQSLPSGMYFLKIYTDKGIGTKRFNKE